MLSSRKYPKYSTAEYCLVLLSFLVMLKEGYCFFPFFNKIRLVLSSPKCIDSLLSRLDEGKIGQFLGIFFFFSQYLLWTCNHQKKNMLNLANGVLTSTLKHHMPCISLHRYTVEHVTRHTFLHPEKNLLG